MPIVALTASVLQEDRDRCVSAGMDAIIGKPVQPGTRAGAAALCSQGRRRRSSLIG